MGLHECAWITLAGVASALSHSVSPTPAPGGNVQKAVPLRVGDAAPVVKATDDRGKIWELRERLKKRPYVVLYFFPADFSPTCTQQAEAWQDILDSLQSSQFEVVGISGDSVKNHRLFKRARNLRFSLLADERTEIASKFGVPIKQRRGNIRPRGPDRRFLKGGDGAPLQLTREATFARWTFVIDAKGTIVYTSKHAHPWKNVEQVIEFLGTTQRTSDPGNSRSAQRCGT